MRGEKELRNRDLLEVEQAGPRSQLCRAKSPWKNWSFKFLWGPREKKKSCWGSGVMCIFLSVIWNPIICLPQVHMPLLCTQNNYTVYGLSFDFSIRRCTDTIATLLERSWLQRFRGWKAKMKIEAEWFYKQMEEKQTELSLQSLAGEKNEKSSQELKSLMVTMMLEK